MCPQRRIQNLICPLLTNNFIFFSNSFALKYKVSDITVSDFFQLNISCCIVVQIFLDIFIDFFPNFYFQSFCIFIIFAMSLFGACSQISFLCSMEIFKIQLEHFLFSINLLFLLKNYFSITIGMQYYINFECN